MKALMQLLYDAACMPPTSRWRRETRRVANRLRAVLARRYDPIVTARVEDLTLAVHASNANPVRYAEDFYKDFPIKRIVRFIVERRGLRLGIVDIGANVGFTALFAHSVAPEAYFLLIEGDPFSCALLRRNTAGIPQCAIENVVLGERDDVLAGEFLQASGTASFVRHGTVAISERAMPFRPRPIAHTMATLDALIARHRMARVDYIKIDTDGAEPGILAGSRKTLATHKPVVFCEFNPLGTVYKGFDPDPLRVCRLFQECGFTRYCVYDQGGRLLLWAEFDRDPAIFEGLAAYCMSTYSVMDVAVFHREAEEFEAFVKSERAHAQTSVDAYLAKYQWRS
jgi:FkbM family methyltransferase